MERMRIEQNTISRDWTVLYKGRRFLVNFTESDGQTLALLTHDNWEISEETDDGIQECDAYVGESSSPRKWQQAKENEKLIAKLIQFCIRNWDNWFMRAVKKGWKNQEPF